MGGLGGLLRLGLGGRRRQRRRALRRRARQRARGFGRQDVGGNRGAPLARRLERREPRAVALRERGELGRQARHHVGPGLVLALAEQPHGRVPRIVLAPDQPAPIGDPGQQHPNRLAERAGQMGDRGIDRDHQVERRHRAGSRGEIVEPERQIIELARSLRLDVAGARPDLQARE